MSYSETITRTDLTNILNSILPQSSYIQSWEYVGDVYWWSNTWTVPDDGFIEVYVEPSASNWYWRISDSKAPDTGWSHRLTGANALTVSQEFFVKKGAVLGTYDMNAVGTAHVYYYKFTLKETIPEPAVDYIVEQGTSGIWTYRKWNSGIAECWYYMTGTTDSSGRWHYNPSLPTFLTSTQIIVNATGWSQGYVTTHAGYTKANYVSNQWSIDGYLENGASSKSCAVSLSVIGKWK